MTEPMSLAEAVEIATADYRMQAGMLGGSWDTQEQRKLHDDRIEAQRIVLASAREKLEREKLLQPMTPDEVEDFRSAYFTCPSPLSATHGRIVAPDKFVEVIATLREFANHVERYLLAVAPEKLRDGATKGSA